MNEQPPHEHDGPDEQVFKPAPNSGPWDPDEHVGDVYRVEIDEQGRVSRADKLDSDRTEQARPERPQIWVGSWLDYNSGILHGDWIHADREDTAIWNDIQTILDRSPTASTTGEVAEDWGVFDFENFGPLRIGESETVAWIGAVARGITEHGPAFAAWADTVEVQEQLAGFADHYLGRYDSVDAFAEQLVDDLGYDQFLDQALPDTIRRYTRIDAAALGRDMQLGGDMHIASADGDGVWIFL